MGRGYEVGRTKGRHLDSPSRFPIPHQSAVAILLTFAHVMLSGESPLQGLTCNWATGLNWT